ncbi:MAG: hypothetical protein AAGH76_03870 [Pseudomonadota bacterium]
MSGLAPIDSDYLARALRQEDWASLATWLADAEERARQTHDPSLVQALLTTCQWLHQQASNERSRVATALRDARTAGTAADTYDSVANL